MIVIDGIGFEVRSHCLVELELVPSADRPQGEWEDYDRYMKCCSKCGWIHDILHYGVHFCPNCGAKMKGADDEYQFTQIWDHGTSQRYQL